MLVRVLGTVEVADGDGWSRAGSPKQSCVLAALALEAGKNLSHPALVHRVWGAQHPLSARNVLYGHITRLRELFRSHPEVELARASVNGYQLNLPPERIDVFAMRRLVHKARAATDTDDHTGAARLWREAAELFRGRPLAGIGGDWAQRTRDGLDRERQEVLIGLYEAELRVGRHTETLTELTESADRYPLSEALNALLMLALYRSERPHDALSHFSEVRSRLREELGNDPGPRLSELQQRILRNDPELLPPATESAVPPADDNPPRPWTPPAQLPAVICTFAGRRGELGELRELTSAPRRAAQLGGCIVAAIDGMAGIGKTALALRLATDLRPEFPDGQLFIDLHGFSPSLSPLSTADALDRLLSGLGVPTDAVGDSVDERAAAYRSALAGKKVLIVLDNASDEEQVSALLPGTAECLAIITSRRRLAGLDDARLISLGALDHDEAVELFNRVAERPLSDTGGAVAELVELCGRLPLAIRIAAGRLRSRRGESIERLRDRISDESRRLSELELGRRSVAVTFGTSFQDLSEQQRDVFEQLGAIPGSDFDVSAVSAVTGHDEAVVESMLFELADLNLIQPKGSGRFHFHDLLLLFAQRHALDKREAVLERLAAHYLRRARGATGALSLHSGIDYTQRDAGEPIGFESPEAAREWLDLERANLIATVDATSRYGPQQTSWTLAAEVGGYYLKRGDLPAIQQVVRSGLTAAEHDDDAPGIIRMLYGLGRCAEISADHNEAFGHYRRALDVARELGEKRSEACVLAAIGGLHCMIGELTEAARCCERSIELDNEIGFEPEAGAFNTLGVVAIEQGRLEQAADFLRCSADIERRSPTGNLHVIECSLALAYCYLGDLDLALQFAGDSLEACRAAGSGKYEPFHLSALAKVHLALGNNAKAVDLAKQGLESAATNGLPMSAPTCLVTMAQAKLPDPAAAAELAAQAIDKAGSFGVGIEEVEATVVLAEATLRGGNTEAALSEASAAVELAAEREYRLVEGWALTVLAEIQYAKGDPAAERTVRQAMVRQRATGHHDGENRSLKLLMAIRQDNPVSSA